MDVWLGIDTATDAASVALIDDAAVLAELSWTSRRRHTVELAPNVERLLGGAGLVATELSGVAVAIGPGSYTGLRIGLAFAKGLVLGTRIPVVPVPTLDVLAAPLSPPCSQRDVPLWAVLRAGRGRLVAGCYPLAQDDWPEPHSLSVHTVAEIVSMVSQPALVAGELDESARREMQAAGLEVLPPAAGLRRAAWLASLGRERLAADGPADTARLSPVYLGDPP